MDLGAYANIDNLEELVARNGISVPRLRGYRLMADEEPLTKEEIAEIELSMVRDTYEDGVRAFPRWDLHPRVRVYSTWTDYLLDYYIDERGDLRWDRIHGKHRKNMKFAVKKRKRRVRQQYDAWNKYAGQPGILYIHARIGGQNWNYYKGYLLEREPWFLEKVDDCFDDTYCDIYAKIE